MQIAAADIALQICSCSRWQPIARQHIHTLFNLPVYLLFPYDDINFHVYTHIWHCFCWWSCSRFDSIIQMTMLRCDWNKYNAKSQCWVLTEGVKKIGFFFRFFFFAYYHPLHVSLPLITREAILINEPFNRYTNYTSNDSWKSGYDAEQVIYIFCTCWINDLH